ncbi:Aspartic peptidase, active site [Sesbania bispinosa]|nr:Aspartic peptidase, active site [Sesbania bispinosa]
MPPKMTERIDSLEAKVIVLEDTVKLSVEEFKQSLLQELSTMLDYRSRENGGGDLRCRVQTFNPCTRFEMMKLARDLEAKAVGTTEKWASSSFRSQGGLSSVHPQHYKSSSSYRERELHNASGRPNNQGVGQTGPVGMQGKWTSSIPPNHNLTGEKRANVDRSRGLKHLTYQELMDRKSKGLCFHCGDKFHPLHQCPERQLRLLVLGDDESVNEEGEIVAIEMDAAGEEEVIECKTMGLCGLNHDLLDEVKTMRLKGKLNGVTIVVLVDSGASHNFISPQVSAALEILVTPTPELGIRLGGDHRVTTRGTCSNLNILLGDVDINIDAYVLDL